MPAKGNNSNMINSNNQTTKLNLRIHAIVPAAGSGLRFGGPVPKQYVYLGGKAIIQHSIERLLEVVDEIILAISDDDEYWGDLPISGDPRIRTISGGKTRAESVQNALNSIENASPNDWVLIHDAVRPLVKREDMENLIEQLSKTDEQNGGLLAKPIYDTVKRANTDDFVAKTENRDGLWTAQTPQMFRYQLLTKALSAAGRSPEITDEALAMEAAGYSVKLIEGSQTNIKITRPDDLAFAKLVLEQTKS